MLRLRGKGRARVGGWYGSRSGISIWHIAVEALVELPEDNREALVLHYFQGEPLAEAARQMERSPPSVAGLLERGLKQLRERLGAGE